MIIKVSMIGLLLLLPQALFAAKPDPMDCPCYESKMLGIAALTSCVTSTVTIRDSLGGGDYQKDYYWLTNPGEFCGFIRLKKDTQDARFASLSCDVWPSQEYQGRCLAREASKGDLTEHQLRSCESALREIQKYIDTLPEC
jgi:hypothetical protein